MKIRRIKLTNFKNFEELEVHLDDFNVIIGANASGKSNFLQAIKFVRDIQEHGLDNAVSLQGGIEYLGNIQSKGKKTIGIEMDFDVSRKGNRDLVYHHKNHEFYIILQHKTIKYKLELSLINGKKYKIKRESLTFVSEIQEIKDKTNASLESPIVHVKDFESRLKVTQGKVKTTSNYSKNVTLTPFSESKIDIKIPIFDFASYYLESFKKEYNFEKSLLETLNYNYIDTIDAAIYDFDLKSAKKPTSITGKLDLEENGDNLAIVLKHILEDKEKAAQFINLLNDVLPFIQKVGVDKFYDKALLLKIREVYNGGVAIPSSFLSDGTISITAILTALLFDKKGINIFEEPEQGIHPGLIAKLIQVFYDRSKEKQIILTTHSPEVVKHTKLENLLFVARPTDKGATIYRPIEREMIKAFLENDLGIDQLFIQNLLDT